MYDEIEKFLMQAAARRRAAAAPPPRRAAPPLRDAEIVEAAPVEPAAQSVAGHVAEHLDTSAMAERATQLGQRVGMADDVMDAHLQQAFSHDVGDLAESAREKPPTAGLACGRWLQSAHDIRRAIILSEILSRPEHRW